MSALLNVLIVGNGGREQALHAQLSLSPLVGAVLCAPGNIGVEAEDRRNIDPMDFSRILQLCKDESVGLVVVGPEAPLCGGLADYLAEHGIKAFGPSKICARLEGSKVGMKSLAQRLGVPTADFDFSGDLKVSEKIIKRMGGALVIKADGLCAGKGVLVTDTTEEALAAAYACQHPKERRFGKAGERILIERKLEGDECSVMALADGTTNCIVLPVARDYKRAFDSDGGGNTGGMGAYAPRPDVDGRVIDRIRTEIILPFLKFYADIGHPFKGVFYAGIMLTTAGPKLLEVNVRFGDPETQTVLPLIKSDLLPYLLASTETGGFANLTPLEVNTGAAVCVVIADRDYPLRGNRLTSVVGTGPTHLLARQDAYAKIRKLRAEGVITPDVRWRNDIALGV